MEKTIAIICENREEFKVVWDSLHSGYGSTFCDNYIYKTWNSDIQIVEVVFNDNQQFNRLTKNIEDNGYDLKTEHCGSKVYKLHKITY